MAEARRIVGTERIPLLRRALCIALLIGFFGLSGGLLAQRRFGRDSSSFPVNSDEKTEWAFARLRYGGASGFRGYSRWSTDYPKADRQFVQGVRRLTQLDVRSMEQVVEPGTDELYNWPWLYAVEVGSW